MELKIKFTVGEMEKRSEYVQMKFFQLIENENIFPISSRNSNQKRLIFIFISGSHTSTAVTMATEISGL